MMGTSDFTCPTEQLEVQIRFFLTVICHCDNVHSSHLQHWSNRGARHCKDDGSIDSAYYERCIYRS